MEFEGHGLERTSPFFTEPGNYQVLVQVGVVAGAAAQWVDDWTFAVESIQP